jgi:uncharacterized protein (TIGR03382 family)
MKTSLQIRALRAAGLALALGLGLAAASSSAKAATVQITLGGPNWTFSTSSNPYGSSGLLLDVTGDNNTDAITVSNINSDATSSPFIKGVKIDSVNGIIARAYIEASTTNRLTPASATFDFQDTRINGGASTRGWAQGTATIESGVPTVTLTRVVFDNASTFAPSFTGSETGITEWSPTSTAVPEPGTFIPAAVLVAGALLRRRRSRSHRSGRATA